MFHNIFKKFLQSITKFNFKKNVKLVKKLDLFAQPLNFLIYKEDKYQTYFGSALTFFLVCFFIVFSINQSLSIINRDKIIVYEREIYNFHNSNIEINNENFVLIFSFEKSKISAINGILKIEIGENNRKIKNIEINQCSNEIINRYFYTELEKKVYFCGFINNFSLNRSGITEDQGSYIKIIFEKNYFNLLSKQFSFHIIKNVLDIQNYLIPLENNLETFTLTYDSKNNYNQKIITCVPIKIITDQSIYTDDYSNIIYDYKLDVNSINNNLIIENGNLEILFICSYKNNIFTRSYDKISKLISLLGGYWSFLYFLLEFIAKYFNKRSLIIKIANELYKIPLTHGNETIEKDKDINTNKKLFFNKNNKNINLINTNIIKKQEKKKTESIMEKPFSRQSMFRKLEHFLKGESVRKFSKTMFYYIFSFFSTSTKKKDIYKKIQLNINKDLDFVHILYKIKEIDKLKAVLLSQEQKTLLEIDSKSNLKTNNFRGTFFSSAHSYKFKKKLRNNKDVCGNINNKKKKLNIGNIDSQYYNMCYKAFLELKNEKIGNECENLKNSRLFNIIDDNLLKIFKDFDFYENRIFKINPN